MLLNGAKRAVVDKGRISACVVTGTDKVTSGYGNGDCLLLDFRNLFFAVADSSDRWPHASRDLLTRLAKGLTPRPDSSQDWLDAVNAAYDQQQYNHRCTFSGVTILPRENGFSMTVLHGGDSLVLVVSKKTGAVEFLSPADMNFAGRAAGIPAFRQVEFSGEEHRIILASDGLADLARLSGQGLLEMCAAALAAFNTHQAPEKLIRFLSRQDAGVNHDDIGFIIINPTRLTPDPELCLLLGGTGPAEEKLYREGLKTGKIPDSWQETGQYLPEGCGFRRIG